MTLRELKIGESAVVAAVGGEGALRQHFLDMGLLPGVEVKLLKLAPMGDPMELLVRGYTLSLRLEEASQIEINVPDGSQQLTADSQQSETDHIDFGYNLTLHEHNSHPGLGEAGKYHDPTHENAVPKGTVLKFALAGQQNCGKTTLFNQLTGSNQHVGNFPGVTVDRKDGQIKGHPDTLVTDLPGIYSLSPYTQEETVSRQFIIEQKPNCIINIVDATNIERNLYLTVQLMELGVPMVLALNMMDELTGNGGSVRVNEMERILGIPVIPISAAKGEGIQELVEHAIHVAEFQEIPARTDFCTKDDHGGAVHRCLHSIMHLIEDHTERAGIPRRFAAGKLVEGDQTVLEALDLSRNEKEMMEHIILQMEEERGMDRSAAIADMRFSFIERLCSQTVVKPRKSREYIRSKRIDRILTGRWTAIPIFLIVMCLVIWLSIDVIGAPLQDWLDQGIQWLAGICVAGLNKADVSPAIVSLVEDALFGGVGSVLSFVPIIIILFFFLSLIEDSGYMARIAFVTDKLLRKLGLSGRSIVPLLIGFGCSVPAVMATRTLPSARDRKLTILLTPFMSCSAKIPIYGFFTNAFFPGHGGLILAGLYLLSILVGVLVALVTKLFRKNYSAAPFVMELPNYRMPGMKNVGHLLWDKTKDFCQRAFTVIFVATIIIWLLQTFDFRFNMVENGEGSMMAWVAGVLEPLFRPLGLGDWRIVTSFVSGFLAKESVVATMEVLGVTETLTVVTAVPMLLFSLLYTPCVAAISSIRRELGDRWAIYVIIFQCAIAWVVAWLGYLIASAVL
ncbi:MAG: ferrous iron transport protein B [Bacteroidaceae bacterium]|nr:ferrous iron transport protein B [Bacteroidaceae bacterium]MBP5647183.1 ferrous iron transport protein B [Bacteroidaceae bacterium]